MNFVSSKNREFIVDFSGLFLPGGWNADACLIAFDIRTHLRSIPFKPLDKKHQQYAPETCIYHW